MKKSLIIVSTIFLLSACNGDGSGSTSSNPGGGVIPGGGNSGTCTYTWSSAALYLPSGFPKLTDCLTSVSNPSRTIVHLIYDATSNDYSTNVARIQNFVGVEPNMTDISGVKSFTFNGLTHNVIYNYGDNGYGGKMVQVTVDTK